MKNNKKKTERIWRRAGVLLITAITAFLSVFGGFDIKTKATGQIEYDSHSIVKGQNIQYSKVFTGGSWSTHYYSYGDPGSDYSRAVYCIESYKSAPGDSTDYWASYIADVKMRDPESYADHALLAAAIAHGPGGKLYYAGKDWWATCGQYDIPINDESMYVITHIAANYAYLAMNNGDISDASPVWQGVPHDYIKYFRDYMQFLGDVADGAATFRDPDHDWANWLTTWRNFKIRIFLPDDSGVQKMAMFMDAEWEGVYYEPGIQINLPLVKTPEGTVGAAFPSMEGAVYGLFTADGTEKQRITLKAEGGINPNVAVYGKFNCYLQPGGGDSWDGSNPYQNDSYYIQEISAPKGYKKDETKHWFYFKRNTPGGVMRFVTNDPIFSKAGDEDGYDYNGWQETMNATVTDKAEFIPEIEVKKDGGTQSVAGAEYTMYRYEYADLDRCPVVSVATIDTKINGSTVHMSGKFNVSFTEADLNKWYAVRETKVPVSNAYQPDKSVFFFRFVNEGGEYKFKAYSNQAATLSGGSTIAINGNRVEINSIEEEGFQFQVDLAKNGDSEDERATLDGTVYTVFNEAGTKIKDITMKVDDSDRHKATGSSGEIRNQPAGNYYIQETKNPKGYEIDQTKHIFHVSSTGVITSASPVISVNGTMVSAKVSDKKVEKEFTPEIQVIKNGTCNVEDEKADVSKAKYGLFDAQDNLLQEITLTGTRTQATGTFSYKIKKLGTYYVKETYSPEYFDLDPEKYTFHVTLVDDELISDHSGFVLDATDKAKAAITVKEKPNKYEWSMKVIKTAETTGDFTSLNDVVYGLFKEDGTELQRINLVGNNTGATGQFSTVITDKAEAGKYYVQEVSTVKGFRLNQKKYPFEVNVVDQKLVAGTDEISVIGNEAILNAVDESEKGKFTFVKKGTDGLVIPGAEFEVYLKSGLTYDETKGTYNFDAVVPYCTLISDGKGVVVSGDLNMGTYVVREVITSPEYYMVEPFEVVIERDLVMVDLGVITDENVPVRIRCTKKDSGRDTVILKAGTTYEIKDSEGNNVSDESGAVQFTCDDTGVIIINADLTPGTYTITEVIPPNAYIEDSDPVVVKVDGKLDYVVENGIHIHDITFANTEKLGEITITKTGKTLTNYENEKFVWEEAPLPGATFEVRVREDIYSPDRQGTLLHKKDEVIGTIVTGADGSATIKDLHLGKYYLVETVAPVGYILDENPIEVILKDGDSVSKKIVETRSKFDERQKVILDLRKFDSETGKPLAGAKFGLYADEDICNFTGKEIVKKGELLSVTKSDENGRIDFDIDLPFGSYMVKEEQAPWGYVINKDEYHFNAEEPDCKIASVTYGNEWGNKPVRGNVIFTKIGETLTDFKDGAFVYEKKSLAGAEFEVHAKEVYTLDHAVDGNGNRTAYYEKDALIEKIIVGDDGRAEIKNYPIGTYYLIETKAPYGMKRMEKPFAFEIKYRDQDTPVVLSEESILNERQKIILSIGKLQRTSNISLNGGTFDLYTGEDLRNYAGKVIVGKDTKIASAGAVDGVVDFGLDLPHGKYYIMESGGIHDHYDNHDIYQVDGTYRNQEIQNLGIDLVIYNDKMPGLGRVMMKVAGASFEKKKNNYITGDTIGSTGYSVLIGEEEDIEESKSMPRRAAVIFGIIMLLVGAVGVILVRSGNKKIVFGDEKKIFGKKNNRKGVKR